MTYLVPAKKKESGISNILLGSVAALALPVAAANQLGVMHWLSGLAREKWRA